MRKYYLFVIRKDVYEVYKNKPDALFRTMNNLYHLKPIDSEYGVSLFHQLCETFHVSLLEDYLKDKYQLTKTDGVYQFENNYIYIKPSRCIIKTNVNMPNIFIDFKCYNRLIFVIDFRMQDYFFLCQDYNNFEKRRI